MNGTTTNATTIKVITSVVAFMAGACVVTICFLSYKGIQIPPELNTLTGTLCGGLTGMLVKTSPTEATTTPPHPAPIPNSAPTPVAVVSSEQNPVHTEEAAKEKVAIEPIA